jgi:hypothetical protein
MESTESDDVPLFTVKPRRSSPVYPVGKSHVILIMLLLGSAATELGAEGVALEPSAFSCNMITEDTNTRHKTIITVLNFMVLTIPVKLIFIKDN